MKVTRKLVATGQQLKTNDNAIVTTDSAHKRSRSVGGVKLLSILKDDDNLSAAGTED